jgi:RecA/RadA recombinase
MAKEIVKTETKKSFSLDINKLVKKAQESYGKNETGLSKQLATGISLIRPSKDEDFVLWTSNDFWRSLTHLKGLPFNRIVMIAGKPDSGKSSCAAQFMVEAQKQGHLVICWDSEQKFNPARFAKLGGDPESLLIVDTNNILNGCKAVAHLVDSAKEEYPDVKILICWDSVGASVNSSEDSSETEDYSKQPGISAKECSFAIRKFNKLANKYIDRKTGSGTIATLIINQVYQIIGSVGQKTKGGEELIYLSSLIVSLSRKQDLTRTKNGEKYKFGIVSRAKVVKNHLGDDQETIAEMDIVVSAGGIQLAKEVKGYTDVQGWDEKDGDE